MSALSHIPSYRILEMIPGTLVWATFITTVVLSFVRPLWIMGFIIAFALLWLLRVWYFILYLLITWRRFRLAQRIDWYHALEKLPGWEQMIHLVVIPTYREPLEVIDNSFRALLGSHYPLKRVIVVLAGEERDKEHFNTVAPAIVSRYARYFYRILVTVHPDNLPGEIKTKGANAHHAAGQAHRFIDEEGIGYDRIIVSYFDSDTCVGSQYFAALTHAYLTHPNPQRTSFQPIPFFTNNVWESPAMMRVTAFCTTFWLMTELARPERLYTFSSHAMSWRALVDVGYWQTDVVTDDSRIFLQCFLQYDGDYTVTPLYVPVTMDTVMSTSWWKSIKNLYRQQRRWGWSIEHLPFMIWNFSHNPRIPWRKKFHYLWNLGEGMYTWATTPILLFVLGRLPLAVSRMRHDTMVLSHTTPYILEWLMVASMVGIVLSAILATMVLPIRPSQHSLWKTMSMVAQWVLLPIILILFGSIPATEAQTRLLLGRYLGFDVTEKVRV